MIKIFTNLVFITSISLSFGQNVTGNGGNDLLLWNSLQKKYSIDTPDDYFRDVKVQKSQIQFIDDEKKRLFECQRFYDYFFETQPYLHTDNAIGNNVENGLEKLIDLDNLLQKKYFDALQEKNYGYLCGASLFQIGKIQNEWHNFVAANFPSETLVVVDPVLMDRLHYSSKLCSLSFREQYTVCLLAGIKAIVSHEVIALIDKNQYYESKNRYLISRHVFLALKDKEQ